MRVSRYSLQKDAVGFAAVAVLAVALPTGTARAQLMDQLKGAMGGGNSGGGAGGLTGGLPSVAQVSPSNTAGVLQYCVRNNYLSGNAASSLKDSLLGKAGGSGSHDDAGFKAGNNGMLETGNGQNFSLSGGGIQEQVTHKVCDMVLQHAKSLL